MDAVQHEPTTATDGIVAPAPREHSYTWLIPVWVVVTVFGLIMVWRSNAVGVPVRDPGGSVLVLRLLLSLAMMALMAPLDAGWRLWRSGRPLSGIGRELVRKWRPRRIVLASAGLLAYALVYFFYHNLKSWDVLNAPRDQMLLDWDKVLFAGHSPAVLLHDLLGQHVSAWVLYVIYESFSTIVFVALVASMVVPERIRDGYVYIAGALWVWILGTASYYAIPSLGPFHSAPHEFAGLPHMPIQDTQADYMAQRAHFLHNPQAPDAWAQVSAFASLHVGVSTYILLMTRYYRLRLLSIAATVWVVGTILATVYLGWHFFVDDIAGVVIAIVGSYVGSRMIYGRTGRPREVDRALVPS